MESKQLITDEYIDREQSLFKHYVLKEYLRVLAMKTGMSGTINTLNYIDGFAGPWKSECENFSDTSPKIAISELLSAQQALQENRKTIKMRFMFVEKDKSAYQNLQTILKPFQKNYDIRSENQTFLQSIPHIQNFIEEKPHKPFNFFFIDPTGWTGFGMGNIRKLLTNNRSEVLINLMTKDITRFIKEDFCKPSFIELFGQERVDVIMHRAGTSTGLERENIIVEEYCNCLKVFAEYDYVANAVIVSPEQNRNYFHLIYGTRSLIGLQEFRRIEENLMKNQKQTRAVKKEQKKGVLDDEHEQLNLLALSDRVEIHGDGGYVDSLVQSCHSSAKNKILNHLQSVQKARYDDLAGFALQLPMVSEKFLKNLLHELKSADKIKYDGFIEGQRVPKLQKNNFVLWN